MNKAGLVFFLAALLTTASSVFAIDETEEFLLVIHPENPVPTLEHEFVEEVFLIQQTKWPDGVSIDVVLNDSLKTAEKFYQDIIGKTSGQYLIYRKKLLFNGMAIPPKSLRDDEEVIRYIAQHVNSIGFISPSTLDWRVKPLAIGKSAGR